MRRSALLIAATALALVAGGAAPTPDARATPRPAAAPPPEIAEAALMADLTALNKIAADNGGDRATATPGFKASLEYIKAKLDAAGFVTRVEPFVWLFTKHGTNLVAEWPHGDPNQVVMAGAHLDSVVKSPGLNDNGSGSIAVLHAALALARAQEKPTKRLRFAWFDAEEQGLRGSIAHVEKLAAEDRKKIQYYLNFDMAGQKDLKTWIVYKDTPELARTWKEYLDSKGAANKEGSFDGVSDHASFKKAGIKVSGFGSGADPCYHKMCDDITNVGGPTMTISANAIAHQLWVLSRG